MPLLDFFAAGFSSFDSRSQLFKLQLSSYGRGSNSGVPFLNGQPQDRDDLAALCQDLQSLSPPRHTGLDQTPQMSQTRFADLIWYVVRHTFQTLVNIDGYQTNWPHVALLLCESREDRSIVAQTLPNSLRRFTPYVLNKDKLWTRFPYHCQKFHFTVQDRRRGTEKEDSQRQIANEVHGFLIVRFYSRTQTGSVDKDRILAKQVGACETGYPHHTFMISRILSFIQKCFQRSPIKGQLFDGATIQHHIAVLLGVFGVLDIAHNICGHALANREDAAREKEAVKKRTLTGSLRSYGRYERLLCLHLVNRLRYTIQLRRRQKLLHCR